MLILRESNGRDWCHSGLSENPTSLRQDIFYPDGHCSLGCSLNRLRFYSLRKETASVKAAESISFPGTCGESVVYQQPCFRGRPVPCLFPICFHLAEWLAFR